MWCIWPGIILSHVDSWRWPSNTPLPQQIELVGPLCDTLHFSIWSCICDINSIVATWSLSARDYLRHPSFLRRGFGVRHI
ncbi:hypothetical protein RSOLAG1IB_03034 [Rhizoctonia solani AG-1 IB]|uniref:Uncharacterized protein n=1 Tax=Thanatephorus cucumeris (strain AG1-IB / isolate 7/3/14) TaxID=1108050 RepID=A0A0B7FPY4_THACB|nr:hypothetical protein RSOLAG1IB_03034 [Rhizoctonia solani AG-1 IB]